MTTHENHAPSGARAASTGRTEVRAAHAMLTVLDDDSDRRDRKVRVANRWYYPAAAAAIAFGTAIPALGEPAQMFLASALVLALIAVADVVRRRQVGLVPIATWRWQSIVAVVVGGVIALAHLAASMLLVRLGLEEWSPLVILSAFVTTTVTALVADRVSTPSRLSVRGPRPNAGVS